MDVKHNFEELSHKHFTHVKAIFTYPDCLFVAFVFRPKKRMRRILLSSVACPALPYFVHVLLKTARYAGNAIEHIMCVAIFFITLSERFFVLRSIERDVIKKVPRYPACNAHAPYYIVMCGRSGPAIFLLHYLKNSTIFRKSC